MHTTNSVDYILVLDGDLWLELDLGDKPATVAVVQVGAARAG